MTADASETIDVVIPLSRAVELAMEYRDNAKRELLDDIITSLRAYTTAIHGQQAPVPLGSNLLEPRGDIPMAWKFATWLEQNWGEK